MAGAGGRMENALPWGMARVGGATGPGAVLRVTFGGGRRGRVWEAAPAPLGAVRGGIRRAAPCRAGLCRAGRAGAV